MLTKRIFSFMMLFIVISSFYRLSAQGLENIIVEKYYISNSSDTSAIGGHLPIGSVTYRIYVDMLPGYKFQAAFGIPGHELRLETTTSFFNNEDKGFYIPNAVPIRYLDHNTVMLDSWLSTGAASEGTWGILKSEDDEAEIIVNKDGALQNENASAGIALKKADGLYSGVPPKVTFFGIDSLAMEMFTSRTSSSKIFSTENGSWATLGGTNGPTSENRVLIAQLTTDGIFSFELNVQLGRPGEGIEQYVARNPKGDEKIHDSLIYTSSSKKKR
jgi:hypothetical protein